MDFLARVFRTLLDSDDEEEGEDPIEDSSSRGSLPSLISDDELKLGIDCLVRPFVVAESPCLILDPSVVVLVEQLGKQCVVNRVADPFSFSLEGFSTNGATLLLLPLNVSNRHWTLLTVVLREVAPETTPPSSNIEGGAASPAAKAPVEAQALVEVKAPVKVWEAHFYDSVPGSSSEPLPSGGLGSLIQYVLCGVAILLELDPTAAAPWRDAKGDPKRSHFRVIRKRMPLSQANGYDCGVFVFEHIRHLSGLKPLSLSQSGIATTRKELRELVSPQTSS